MQLEPASHKGGYFYQCPATGRLLLHIAPLESINDLICFQGRNENIEAPAQ